MSGIVKGFIYLVLNNVDDEVYVGCTITPVQVRFNGHKGSARKGSHMMIHRHMRKIGITSFYPLQIRSIDVSYKEIEVKIDNELQTVREYDRAELLRLESLYIKRFGTLNKSKIN